MSSLLTSILNSAGALSTYQQAFNVIENNIANANTPGYSDQNQSLEAQPFDPSQGLSGGVLAGPLLSSRSQYLEQDVRNQQELLGNAQQSATDLGQVQPLFDLTNTSGISDTMSALFNSFSDLTKREPQRYGVAAERPHRGRPSGAELQRRGQRHRPSLERHRDRDRQRGVAD